MGKKLLFIYNPKAGKAQIKSKLADILDIFAEAEYEITVVPTRKRDDARLATAGRSKKDSSYAQSLYDRDNRHMRGFQNNGMSPP